MRYSTADHGERKPRHVIETFLGNQRVGDLVWYGTTGTIHHIDVEQEYTRQGIATAMWEWGQEMSPKPKHSGDRTPMGDAWARSVGGPIPRRKASLESDVRQALVGLDLPHWAVDGDCLTYPGTVLGALRKAGYEAHIATVWGWVQPNVVGFIHQAVEVNGLIVDPTATQYDRALPSLIIEPVDAYKALMVRTTGVSTVTIE